MSSARCSDGVADEEVRETKKLKMVVADELQTKTDEELAELILTNKRNVGLLELVLPNKANALKEAIKSYEDEIHRRAANLFHSPKLYNSKLVIKVEGGDQIVAGNENSEGYIRVEEPAESHDTVGTNVINAKQVIKVEVGNQCGIGNENSSDGFIEHEIVGTFVVEPKVPEFSTQQKVEVNIPKELKPKQSGRKLWVEAEETLLAMAFIHTPEEYVVVGSSQQSNMCWNRFLSYFNQNNTSGIRRNEDQIRSKWRNMNIKIANFNEIFTRVMKKHKGSWSDDDINIRARQTYKKEVGTHFTLDHVWNLLKDSSKWKSRFVKDQKTSQTTKPYAKEQVYTSSSSSSDEDNADGSVNLEDDEAKLERPSSNKSPKRVEKSKASSSSTSSKVYEAFLQRGQTKDDNFLQLKETLDLHNKLRREKLKMDAEKIQIQAEKLKNENITFLLQDASSLTGIDLDIVLRRKVEIRNKYSN